MAGPPRRAALPCGTGGRASTRSSAHVQTGSTLRLPSRSLVGSWQVSPRGFAQPGAGLTARVCAVYWPAAGRFTGIPLAASHLGFAKQAMAQEARLEPVKNLTSRRFHAPKLRAPWWWWWWWWWVGGWVGGRGRDTQTVGGSPATSSGRRAGGAATGGCHPPCLPCHLRRRRLLQSWPGALTLPSRTAGHTRPADTPPTHPRTPLGQSLVGSRRRAWGWAARAPAPASASRPLACQRRAHRGRSPNRPAIKGMAGLMWA